MKQKSFGVVAISPDPRALTAFRGQCKVLPPNRFVKPPHHFFDIHFEILIPEQLVLY